eukprot:2294437-Lingulodinium_polyedra.AAC.1
MRGASWSATPTGSRPPSQPSRGPCLPRHANRRAATRRRGRTSAPRRTLSTSSRSRPRSGGSCGAWAPSTAANCWTSCRRCATGSPTAIFPPSRSRTSTARSLGRTPPRPRGASAWVQWLGGCPPGPRAPA